ncbi:MAG: hypothetical protein K2L66_05510 [Paramuribaculum sp.]|nr:hypothetical protein [Paramuribaculum sp.]
METDENLIRFMDAVASGEAVPAGLADRLIADYPWFVLPAAMRLQRGSATLDADERQILAARVALGMADRTAMLRLADDRGRMFDGFYPPAPGDETPTTETAIDTFLNAYGTIDPAEEALLERLIFNPVADYSQVLIKEQEESRQGDGEEPEADEQDRLMDAFIDKYSHDEPEADSRQPEIRPATPRHTASRQAPPPDSMLSESLAKIYIKRRRYEKAYEIIHTLSLNFPEKSIYFADQLRFLQKLILNNNLKQK